MSQYTIVSKQVEKQIGKRTQLLVSEGPDEVVGTWQWVTVEDATLHRSHDGFDVESVTYKGYLDDGRLVYGGE